MKQSNKLIGIYRRLYERYGAQHWWPANTRFEMILGAILTQNTAWTNVEKAIYGLKKEGLLSLKALRKISQAQLARVIRPSGFFNQKAKRIKSLVRYLDKNHGGRLTRLLSRPAKESRGELLSLSGIGPETADSILLYAANRPVFVVDAYTRRIFHRLGILEKTSDYEAIRAHFEVNLPPKPSLFNEYHALIVRHAKTHCRKKPICQNCPLDKVCLKRTPLA
jgi:endonuclease III related protein